MRDPVRAQDAGQGTQVIRRRIAVSVRPRDGGLLPTFHIKMRPVMVVEEGDDHSHARLPLRVLSGQES